MNARDRAGRRTPVAPGSRPATASPRGTSSRPSQLQTNGRSRHPSAHPTAEPAHAHARRVPRSPSSRHSKRLPAGATFNESRLERRDQEAKRARHQWRVGQTRRRLIAVFVVTALCFGAVLVRVGLLQIAEAEDYQAYGDRQRVRSEVIVAPRGRVLDRDGIDLAMSVASSTVFANPKAVVNPSSTAQALAELLGLDEKRRRSLEMAFTAQASEFVYVSRQVESALAKTISDLHLPGVGVLEEPRRYLPNGDVARGVIGRTDIDGVGTGGVELQYNSVLTGTSGQLRREFGSKGRSMPSGDKALIEAIPGNDVRLTIDMTLQYRVEQYLVAAVAELMARGGSAIVMDSQTGEILVMASVRRDPESGLTEVASGNYAAVDAYEPGSVMKVITVAGALDQGAVTPERTFVVPSEKKFYDLVLHDAEPHPPVPYTVHEILSKSSNIGTIFVSQTMGVENQENYMRAFGIGEATALDFPGESRGILKPHEEWYGTENVTMAYGQGVSSTAVQLVSAVNVLANHGVYVAPKLVKSVIAGDGTEQVTMPSATRVVVTPEVADQMNVMLRDVVCTGTARGRIDVPGYTVAGKTGTGYKGQANGTYFDEDGNRAYYASFVGFLPAEAPRLTILVSIDEPPPGARHFGSTTAAPVFAQIASAAIVELGIQPPTADGGCPVRKRSK